MNVTKKGYVKLRRLFKPRKKKAGLPPGSMVYTGEKKADKIKITLLDYDENTVTEKKIEDLSLCEGLKDKPSMTWIDVEGVHDVSLLETLGNQFGLHPLVMEDIVSTDQRPKMEEFDDYIYIVLKMFHHPPPSRGQDSVYITGEQVSIIMGKQFVLTFQEGYEGDVFEPLRERIRKGGGKIHKMSSDYLVYNLIDSIIDGYFTILENIGEKIEDLEEILVNNPQPKTLTTIYELKREMIYLRKNIWPLREVISQLEREDSELITESTHIYLRDVYDHTIHASDTIETYRDMLSGMLDIYLSSISNRMNEIMKVLTIITTIFIPLSFIAGIYGMNFEFMPELKERIAYPIVLGVMLVIAIFMLFYFRRKKWI